MNNQDDNFLSHHGVKGMKWGVRHDREGNLRNLDRAQIKTSSEAEKDAIEYARAKMFYGEGAGNRRKLINATVKAKKNKDPFYASEFDNYLADQDMSVHAQKARSERKKKDTTKAVKKGGKKVARAAGTVARFVPYLMMSDTDSIDNFLSHHGVEGMKWGVRHDPERKGYGDRRPNNQKGQPPLSQREIAKRERAIYKKKKLPKTSLGLFLRNRNLSEAEYRQAKKKIERDRDVYEGFLRDIQNIQRALDIPVNALNSGVKTVKNIDYINTLFGGTSFTDRKPSTRNNKWRKKFDSELKIVHSNMNLPSLVHSDTEDIDNFLCHYGVLGMKWGVRRAEEANNMYHQTESYARHKILNEMLKSGKISKDQYKRSLASSKAKFKAGLKQNKANSKSALAELKKSGRSGDDYYKSVMDQLESNRKGFRDIHTYNKAMQSAGAAGGLAGLAGGAVAGKATGHSFKNAYGNYINNNRAAIEKDIYDELDKFKLSHSDTEDIDNFLCHYGRKGMKWGQHIFGDEETLSKKYGYSPQEANRRLTNLDNFYKKHVIRRQGWLKPWNAWADKSYSFYNNVNKKYTLEKPVDWNDWDNNDEQAKAYIKECANGFKNGYKAEIDKVYGKYAKQNLPENYYEVFPGYTDFDELLAQENKRK